MYHSIRKFYIFIILFTTITSLLTYHALTKEKLPTGYTYIDTTATLNQSQCYDIVNDENIQFLNESKIDKNSDLRHRHPIYLFSSTGSGNTMTRILLEYITSIWTGSLYNELDNNFMVVKGHPKQKLNETLSAIFLIGNPWKSIFAEFNVMQFNKNNSGDRHSRNVLLENWNKTEWAQFVMKATENWLQTLKLMENISTLKNSNYILIDFEKLTYFSNCTIVINEMNKILQYIYSDIYYNQHINDILMRRMQCIFPFLLQNNYARLGTFPFHTKTPNPKIHLTFDNAFGYLITHHLDIICDAWSKMKHFASILSYENILHPIVEAQCSYVIMDQYITHQFISTPISSNHTCNIVVAYGPDKKAGYATGLFLYGINFFLYAERHNMTLWVDYRNKYNKKMSDSENGLYGENVWEYYFEPVQPENNGCNRNKSNLTILSQDYVYPTLHVQEPWAIHAWYYHFNYKRKHNINSNYTNDFTIDYDTYYPNWYTSQRKTGYAIVSKYFHYKSHLVAHVNDIWRFLFGNNSHNYQILGVHMRGTDKAGTRRKVLPKEYLFYINKFVKYYGQNKAKVFVATDDRDYLRYIQSNFNGTIYTQTDIQRSDSQSKIPVFGLKTVSKYDIGIEVLTDILLLSRCNWFIHSASAVAESVFYNNIELDEKSVNLEYTKNRQTRVW